MIITSFEFLLFFCVVMGVRSCLRSFNSDKWFLLVASYAFYMSWSIPCGFLILGTSLVDYVVGVGLERIEDERKRKSLLTVSIVANLGVLAYFKYFDFFLGNASATLNFFGLHVPRWHFAIILPAGISFFTFQSMTYTIETYRRNIKVCHSLRDFLLFQAFFPQLLAGPINRAALLLPQFAQRMRASYVQIESGLAQFGMGAVKKMVISDQIFPHVDMIFANPGTYDSLTLLLGAIGYSIQIYCDFSGYSDMAIGCARMMGFHFNENFQMPYSSLSITEFWRRWHISLSSWFRDYLYIPLGGSRKGTGRTYVNLLVTMLLCGLWHGSSWNFVFWGGLNGIALAIHRIWTQADPLAGFKESRLFLFGWNLIARALTLGLVLVGWIFFRAHSWSSAGDYLGRMVGFHHDGIRFISPYILASLLVVFLAHLLVPKDCNWFSELLKRSVVVRAMAYAALIFLIVCFGATDATPFIYFQF